MASILTAIKRFAELDNRNLSEVYEESVGVNSIGDKFEYFVKDLISDSIETDSIDTKHENHERELSWLGSRNHPPDIVIRNDDAIEVKKSSGLHPSISLNSSPPRQTIKKDTVRITEECRAIEGGDWYEKDMLYALGSNVSNGDIGFMWNVYGDCWCSSNEHYLKIVDSISKEAKKATNVPFNISGNEIGKVKNADPHGRASLRVRPMWKLQHPATYFKKYVDDYKKKIDNGTPMFTVMRLEKLKSFDSDEQRLLQDSDSTVKKISAPDPDHFGETIDCVLIETV